MIQINPGNAIEKMRYLDERADSDRKKRLEAIKTAFSIYGAAKDHQNRNKVEEEKVEEPIEQETGQFGGGLGMVQQTGIGMNAGVGQFGSASASNGIPMMVL